MLIWFNVLIRLLVLDVPLRKLLQQIVIKTRSGVLLLVFTMTPGPGDPLIPADFFCFLFWWRSRP